MTTLSFNSRRSPVYGRGGIVATSQLLATATGLEILANGGNAADAVVAAGAALNVTEPTSTGIGGDMFALYFSADTKRVTALNGSGRAPSALTLDRLKSGGFASSIPPFHAHTVTVPGACAGWCDLIQRHGSLSMSEILAPWMMDSIRKPRWIVRAFALTWTNQAGGRVAIEEGMPESTFIGLQKMGHPVYSVSGYDRALFGRGQVILRDEEMGVLCAGTLG
jgi:gamma-glutamyltranspeptidase